MMAFNDEPGDNGTMAHFYEAHKAELLKFARRILRDDEWAADALQDSFVNLIHSYDMIRGFPEEKLLRYSMSVVRNQCYYLCQMDRADVLYDPQVDTELLERDLAGPDVFARLLDGIVLQEAVSKLRPNYRLAIVMRYFYDLDDAAIGIALEIKTESVRTVLTRARRQLKKLCKEEVRPHA